MTGMVNHTTQPRTSTDRSQTLPVAIFIKRCRAAAKRQKTAATRYFSLRATQRGGCEN